MCFWAGHEVDDLNVTTSDVFILECRYDLSVSIDGIGFLRRKYLFPFERPLWVISGIEIIGNNKKI